MSAPLLQRIATAVAQSQIHSSSSGASSSALTNTLIAGVSALRVRGYASAPKDDIPSHVLRKMEEEKQARLRNDPQNPSDSDTPPHTRATAEPPQDQPFSFDVDSSQLAISEGSQAPTASRTGARARRSPSENQSSKLTGVLGFGVVGGLAWAGYTLAKPWDDYELENLGDKTPANLPHTRAWQRVTSMWEDTKKPQWEKLLPDLLPIPYQRPYTLVVDLDDLLVHSEWSRTTGWRTAKRPGLDYFLGYLSQFYEIVIFTTDPFFTAGPVAEKLDPDRRFIAYTLFKESCRRLDDGTLVKDLRNLNRDPAKTIVLDTDESSFQLQPENGILIKPWKGEKGDRELIDLLPFLEAIGINNVPDVRSIIASYGNTNVAAEHAKREIVRLERDKAEWQQKQARLGNNVGSLFGGMRSSSNASTSGPPQSWYDQERGRYQQAYQEDEKFWRENGERLRREAKEEQERQIKDMKISAWGMLTGQAQPPQSGNQSQ